jgi:hypothetical protein
VIQVASKPKPSTPIPKVFKPEWNHPTPKATPKTTPAPALKIVRPK